MRLLVKANHTATSLRIGLGGARTPITLRPLMPSIDMAGSPKFAAAGKRAAWHVTESLDPRGNPWDVCHALVRDGLGIGPGDEVAIAEPDLEQQWVPEPEAGLGVSGGQGSDGPTANPQSDDYPKGPEDGWFALREFSGLAQARQALGEATPRIRIAHLDTGYDPTHRTVPTRLRVDLARNFADPVDGQPQNGAVDQTTAAVNPMFGHGTATLALLAGEPYGGARAFEVVPVRVANWVMLFRNSAIAGALDYVHSLSQNADTRCDVLSMSMGGLASAAWADAVNALYDAGVVVVTAAGNNFGNLPVRSIVYPARFNRVLAACGVMADGRPYADLAARLMAGCYGPDRKMRTALSAWTPNAPWARFGSPERVDQTGRGTSAATPQIAAAAALWLHQHADALKDHAGWQRVEAVRQALFQAADSKNPPPDDRLGRGVLRALAALDIAPALPATLRQEAEDNTSFALIRLLTGLGAASGTSNRMLELEALQISQKSGAVEAALGGRDPSDRRLADTAWRSVLEALADAPGCSATLRGIIQDRLHVTQVPVGADPPGSPVVNAVTPRKIVLQPTPPVPAPTGRRLRVFAFDPGFMSLMTTRQIATTTIQIEWEGKLREGPVGEYLEVVDIDPSSHRAYAPIDLNQPEILAQDGLEPSEGSPQFHQQMAYAVAMKTIGHFRSALGRVPFWAERTVKLPDGRDQKRFVRRLRVYPHALREMNAYYSPEKRALLFGYFRAVAPGAIDVMQGGMVFTCLSHDIVAHETTHALLDGLHPRWKEPTNPDMPAFHEAFADLVALFQHFTMPAALLTEIKRARGQLRVGAMMGKLAQQFGQATGLHGALRDAIGKPGDPGDYSRADGPHKRGEVLVAAVFDAWLQVYEDRTADLFRLATGGTGVLPRGEIPHDLALRLAEEAARLAAHFLNICIRALDYCPPVDLSFGEYLRAMITADYDLVKDDPLGYRVALVDGFRKRGIMPQGVQTWSPEALVWAHPEADVDLDKLCEVLNDMAGNWQLNSDRYAAWTSSRDDARTLHKVLMDAPDRSDLLDGLGLREPGQDVTIDAVNGRVSAIEVHSVRPARRVGPNGQVVSSVVIEITQGWVPEGTDDVIRGGCTIIWDRTERRVRYLIRKRVVHPARIAAQQGFRLAAAGGGSAYGNYFDGRRQGREPFAIMHSDS